MDLVDKTCLGKVSRDELESKTPDPMQFFFFFSSEPFLFFIFLTEQI